MQPFGWVSATTVSEAANAAATTVADAMARAPDAAPRTEVAVIKAGGIDVLDLVKARVLAPARLVSLRNIPELDAVREEAGGGVRIGAMVTLAAVGDHALLRRRYPALAAAAQSAASPQIRNVATLGGNLLQRPRCWYFRAEEFRCLRKGGDQCFALRGENQYHAVFGNRTCAIVHPSTAATVLVALGASVELADGAGNRRRPRLEDFLVAPERDVERENDLRSGELLTAIHVPALPGTARMAHVKQAEKAAYDWPVADVAVVLDVGTDGVCRSAAIVLGAAAPVPHRATAAERILAGQRIDGALAARAARASLEGATPLAKNAYKLPIFEALVRRALATATA